MTETNGARDRPFAELIPELYRQDPALDALLDVLERRHLELEALIEQTSLLYRIDSTPEPFLDFLGELVGLRNGNRQFTPAQMRDLIPDGFWLHRWKGTRIALEYILYRYLRKLCGRPVPFAVAEPGEAGNPGTEPGKRPLLAVYAAPVGKLADSYEQARLEMLVRDYTPATVDIRVDYGKEKPLGGTYLGYTTFL